MQINVNPCKIRVKPPRVFVKHRKTAQNQAVPGVAGNRGSLGVAGNRGSDVSSALNPNFSRLQIIRINFGMLLPRFDSIDVR